MLRPAGALAQMLHNLRNLLASTHAQRQHNCGRRQGARFCPRWTNLRSGTLRPIEHNALPY
eukprot:11181257-Lingulodinium_polyedra.AAC.1